MEDALKAFGPIMKHLYATQGTLSKAFYERYGKEALPIIAEVMSQSGVASAEIVRKMMPVKGMKDVGELFKMMGSVMELEMEVIEVSDEAIHTRESACPLGLEGTSKELCEAMLPQDAKSVATLLGREVETKLLKSVAAGDEKCEVIFSIK